MIDAPSSPPPAAAEPLQDATVVLNRLGQEIVASPAYKRRDWRGIALVTVIEPGHSEIFGYVYGADGDWEAEIPDGPEVMQEARALQQAMRQPGKAAWTAALFQLLRTPEIKFHADFEYDDAKRWKVTPQNLQQRVEELRPR